MVLGGGKDRMIGSKGHIVARARTTYLHHAVGCAAVDAAGAVAGDVVGRRAEPSRAERRAEQHSTSRQRASARERRFLPPVPVVITTQAGVADAPGDTPGAELSEGGGVRQGENMFRPAGPLARDGAARTRARDIAPDAGVPRGPRGPFTGAARPMRGRRSHRPPTRGRAAARAQSHTRARAPHPHFTRPLAVAQRPRGPRRPTLAALYPPRARAGRTGETRLIT